MRGETLNKHRQDLYQKLLEALRDEIGGLPEDLRNVLIDDLVTAFENRLAVFSRICSKKDL